MSKASNIDELPVENNGGEPKKPVQNVSFAVDETPLPSGVKPSNSTLQLSPDDVNKIVSGIQEASKSNLTSLPSRDIPTQQTPLTMDEESANPNYVPSKKQEDYIENNANYEALLKQQYQAKQNQTNQDEVFNELQTPILISLLFFIFQLPVFRKYMFMYLPSLFLNDGNLSLSGILVKSLLFGVMYFGSTKLIDYVSEM